MNVQEREQAACHYIDAMAQDLRRLGSYLHQHPELGRQEHKAVEAIRAYLQTYGFQVEVGLSDLPELATSMRAQLPTMSDATKRIAFLGEYDALPGLGHGCGHNLIATMAVGAVLAFSHVAPTGWSGTFLGCPAEETIGGKVFMAQEGLFKGYEAALIIHPGGETEIGGTSLATHPLEVTYHGRSAHIASLTDSGLNALDSAVALYQKVRQLKSTLPKGALVGTVFTKAGEAPNIIPDEAQLHMTVRGATVDDLENRVLPAIKAAAQEVANQEGTQVDMRHYEPLFKDMRQDACLLKLFGQVMEEFGEEPRYIPDDEADGSTDVGNVSYEVPTAQPTLTIGRGLEAHTMDFTCAAGSDYGLDQAIKGAKIMAVTALRFLTEQEGQGTIK